MEKKEPSSLATFCSVLGSFLGLSVTCVKKDERKALYKAERKYPEKYFSWPSIEFYVFAEDLLVDGYYLSGTLAPHGRIILQSLHHARKYSAELCWTSYCFYDGNSKTFKCIDCDKVLVRPFCACQQTRNCGCCTTEK